MRSYVRRASAGAGVLAMGFALTGSVETSDCAFSTKSAFARPFARSPLRNGPPLESARSVRILRDDEPLYGAPDDRADRRGAAERWASFAIRGTKRGPGCRESWVLIEKDAWLCTDHVLLRTEAPSGHGLQRTATGTGLPFDYYFVGPEGSFGYEKLSLAEEVAPDAELQPGFAVAIVQIASKAGRDPFGLTTKGLWLPLRDLAPARPSTFTGSNVLDGRLDGAWTIGERVRVHSEPAGRISKEPALERLTRLRVLELSRKTGQTWVKIGDARWVNATGLALETPSEMPPEVGERQRWIDIDLANQVLIAYEGRRPVFTTLVSTGRGKGDDPQATPKGSFRIWVKLRTSDMTNLENEEANRYYAMEEVPWVMFFNKGYGLHGAYWHRSFGRVRSHGCVNLAPADAERLFQFTDPPLPRGWSAVLPTDTSAGTLIRVR